MNIAIISHPTFPIPPDTYGGIQRGVYDLSIGLADKGHKILLFCSENSTIKHKNIKKIYIADYGLGEAQSTEDTISVLRNLQKMILKYKNEIDVINLRWESVEAQNICKMIRKPVVLSISCAINEEFQKDLYSNDVIYTSHTNTHSLSLSSIPNIITSNYGISFDSVEKCSNEINKLVLPDKFTVCIAGIQKEKGQRSAIEIARRSNIPIIIAGDTGGTTEAQDYYDLYVKKVKTPAGIIHIGEVNECQKNELFRRASFSIVASGIENPEFKEPFGRVIAESLMNGCPVLGFIGGGSIVEQVRNNIDGYLFSSIDETPDLIAKITNLDRGLIALEAKKRLSSEKFIDTMQKIFNEVIHK